MKRLFLILFMFSVLGSVLYAQGRYSVKDRVANLKSKLSLNDRQTLQVDSILTSASEKIKNLPEDSGDRRAQMRSIMTEANNQVMNVLTDEQKTQYQKMQDERKERMKNRRNSGNQ